MEYEMRVIMRNSVSEKETVSLNNELLENIESLLSNENVVGLYIERKESPKI